MNTEQLGPRDEAQRESRGERTPWRERLREAYRRLRGGELSPARLAGSIALGLFVGCLPIYGGHLALCVLIGGLLRLDVLVAYAAAHISIPPMIPLLLFASAQVGSKILEGQWLPLSPADVRAQEAFELGKALALGSVVVGALASSLGAGVSFALAAWWSRTRRVQPDPTADSFPAASLPVQLRTGELEVGRPAAAPRPLEEAVQRTTERYSAASAFHRHYVYFKLRTDPLTLQLHDLAKVRRDWGHVVDVGTGRGQFAWLLWDLGLARSMTGFDVDTRKVEIARQAGRSEEGVRFFPGALGSDALGSACADAPDTILLLDVLHYLPKSHQKQVLAQAVSHLSPDGVLLVRENNRGAGFGACLAAGFEWLARWFGINRGSTLCFWEAREISKFLADRGLVVQQANENVEKANVLLIASCTRH